MDAALRCLLDAASRPFQETGRYAWHFARGKLRRDPVYFTLLEQGILPDAGTLLDLGCGQGILLALLVAASERFRRGEWPAGWPPPPGHLDLRGIEVLEGRAGAARAALGDRARIECRDIRDAQWPACSAVVMLDVLYHFTGQEQEDLLRAAARALTPGGVLILREADSGAGIRFRVTRWMERLSCTLRGIPWRGHQYRSAAQWAELLDALGFAVRAEPMSRGTPFANVLFVARRLAQSAPAPMTSLDSKGARAL